MANNPLTLLQGTTANATDVEAKVNPLYSDVDETNVDQTAIMVLTNVNQTVLGKKSFNTQNGIKVPNSAPSEAQALGYASNTLQFYDGTAARTLLFNISGTQDFIPIQNYQQGLWNIAFAQGADSSQLKITGANGAALSSSNPGFVRIRSSTAGTWRTFLVTADVTIDLTNAHWGLDTKGNVTGAILRVYAIDDNGTLRWGVGYCGGFYYIRNTQDDTTGSNINLPEEILVNSGVGTDNSPMRDVGWIKADFTDSSNEWAITEYHPGESADGIWQPFNPNGSGFSSKTADEAKWTQFGKTAIHAININGTSNATTFGYTLPTKFVSGFGSDPKEAIVSVRDNGVTLTTAGRVNFNTSSAGVTIDKDPAGGTWTASGAKFAIGYVPVYEVFQP